MEIPNTSTLVRSETMWLRLRRDVYSTSGKKKNYNWRLEINTPQARNRKSFLPAIGIYLPGGATLNKPGENKALNWLENIDRADLKEEFLILVKEINSIPPQDPSSSEGGTKIPSKPIKPTPSLGAMAQIPIPVEKDEPTLVLTRK